MSNRDEAGLIAQIKAGDLQGFEQLVRPYQGRLYQAILRIVRNPASAADVYQDTMLTAFEKIDGFRGKAAFGTWLFRIGVNYALMHCRAARRNPVVCQEDLPRFNWMGGYARPVYNWADSVEESAQRAEVRAMLARALDELPDLERTIVWLKDVEGLSHADIAASTDSTVLAVRSRLHRARLCLRAWLTQRLERS